MFKSYLMESPDRDFTFLHDSSCRIRRSKNVCNVLKKIEFESLHYAEETVESKSKRERYFSAACMLEVDHCQMTIVRTIQ